jgi:hypothetical protein
MKRKLLVGTAIVAFVGLPLTTMASESDCFPLCPEPVKVEATVEAKIETAVDVKLDAVYIVAHRDAAIGTNTATSCDSGFMKSAEELNDRVKPIREFVGYVRSPQGLVIKLVNDHIVKIPVWIGYAMDPIGSIKRKAIDEVRTRAKDAMADDNACMVVTAKDWLDASDANDASEYVDAKHSI